MHTHLLALATSLALILGCGSFEASAQQGSSYGSGWRDRTGRWLWPRSQKWNKPRAMDVIAAMNGARIMSEAAEMRGTKGMDAVAAMNEARVMGEAAEMPGTKGMDAVAVR